MIAPLNIAVADGLAVRTLVASAPIATTSFAAVMVTKADPAQGDGGDTPVATQPVSGTVPLATPAGQTPAVAMPMECDGTGPGGGAVRLKRIQGAPVFVAQQPGGYARNPEATPGDADAAVTPDSLRRDDRRAAGVTAPSAAPLSLFSLAIHIAPVSPDGPPGRLVPREDCWGDESLEPRSAVQGAATDRISTCAGAIDSVDVPVAALHVRAENFVPQGSNFLTALASDPVSPSVAASSGGQDARLAGHIRDTARDLVALSGEGGVRFNVRPETLGPVAVTIVHHDDGPSLQMFVDTPVALQALRQAEPALSEAAARGGSPFGQVTVDLSSPERRGQSASAVVLLKRTRAETARTGRRRTTAISGRYA